MDELTIKEEQALEFEIDAQVLIMKREKNCIVT